MLKKMLVTLAFVLTGSIAAFAQNGTANCPPEKVQVVKEIKVDVGGNGGTIRETSCERKGEPLVDRAAKELKEFVDKVKGGFDRNSGRNGGGW